MSWDDRGAFAGLAEAAANGVVFIRAIDGSWGTGFAVQCAKVKCLLTAGHVVSEAVPGIIRAWLPPADFHRRVGPTTGSPTTWQQIGGGKRRHDEFIDLAAFPRSTFNGKTWELPPEGYELKPGQPLRAIVIDYRPDAHGTRWDSVETYVLDAVVASVTADTSTFMFTASTLPGNSGGVVVNEKMEVIGLITHGYDQVLPFIDRGRLQIPTQDRSRAVHFNAIRQQLREWDLLD